MGLSDMLLTFIIFGGAISLLYNSISKKKGGCEGCNGNCDSTKPKP